MSCLTLIIKRGVTLGGIPSRHCKQRLVVLQSGLPPFGMGFRAARTNLRLTAVREKMPRGRLTAVSRRCPGA